MFSLIKVITALAMPLTQAGCPENELLKGLVVETYGFAGTLGDAVPLDSQMTKLNDSTALTAVPSVEYIYSIAYSNPRAGLNDTTFDHYFVKVLTTGLLDSRSVSTNVKGKLRYVGDVISIVADVEMPSLLQAELPADAKDSGFWLVFTAMEYNTLKSLYFTKAAPVSELSYTKTAEDTVSVRFSSPVVVAPGRVAVDVSSTVIDIDALRDKPVENVAEDILKQEALMKLLADASGPCNIKRKLSTAVLKKLCIVNEDIKLTRAINNCANPEESNSCNVSSDVALCSNFTEYSNQITACVSVIAGAMPLCDGNISGACQKSSNVRGCFNAITMMNFYNCAFSGYSVGGLFTEGLKSSYGITAYGMYTVEDFCESYGIDSAALSCLGKDMLENTTVAADEITIEESTKDKKKTTKKAVKQESFIAKHKVAIIVTSVGCGLAVCGAVGYAFL